MAEEQKIEEVKLGDTVPGKEIIKEENVAAAVGCIPIIGWILAYLSKKDSVFVKFCIFQSVILSVAYFVLVWLLTQTWVIGIGYWGIISPIITIIWWGYLLLLIYMTYMAYHMKKLVLPIVGDVAKQYSEK